MRTRTFRALLLTIVAMGSFSFVSPVHAAVLDSQTDDSAQATRPPYGYLWFGPVKVQMLNYLTVGYVPKDNLSIAGVRFRVNTSDAGNYVCPTGELIQYYGTSTPSAMDDRGGTVVGGIVPVATTTPDVNGNCDYMLTNRYGIISPISVSPDSYYVFFLWTNGQTDNWLSMSGKPYSSSAPQSFFGYRPAADNRFIWGTNGLESAYLEVFDTAPPAATPIVPPDPCIAAGTCVSNVLFLPGIEGSRLYEGTGCGKVAEEKLWDPLADSFGDNILGILRGAGDKKVGDLALNVTGTSTCADIYTKTGDVIDSVGGSNIYKSFLDEMSSLKTGGTIKDWKPVSYDWRLSLDDLLSKGTQHGDKIFYEEATSTPYIEQTLRALAASSKTGKVTIVAHSNGGLVTKALLNKLGGPASKSLVDKIIMVGVPQSGTPEDVGSMLVGYGAGLYAWKGIGTIVSNVAARTFVQNSPMAYHLLPSEDYLASIIDEATHPVVHFAGNGYAKEIAAYGNSIVDLPALDDFLLAKEDGRTKPRTNDLMTAEILNPSLIAYANSTHAKLDFWTPPAGIEVDQIAGWGVDTVGGVDFYTAQPTAVVTAFEPYRTYKPIFIEDGDGTVPVPSALMMVANTDVKRYWLNLAEINDVPGVKVKRSHADLFEIPSLEDFIKNILQGSTSTLPAYISTSQPAPVTENKKLTFFLHSPLTLELSDAAGNVTGLAEDGTMTQDIPGSSYGEFGEVKYISVPQGSSYQLAMHGQASGTFSLDIQESVGGAITASSTIASVPTTASTLASLVITDGIDTASPLTVDENGDGKEVITIAPKSGETVSYEPPAPVPPAPTVGSGAGSGGSTPPAIVIESLAPAIAEAIEAITQAIAPAIIATTTEPIVTPLVVATTTPVSTTTVAAVTPRRSVAIVSSRPNIISPVSPKPAEVIPATPDLSQTASVYNAVSQRPFFKKIGETVYNGLYGFWALLKKFF